MNKENLIVHDLLGRRILIAPIYNPPFEARVIECSQDGKYCKLEWPDGDSRWVNSDPVITLLADILEDKP